MRPRLQQLLYNALQEEVTRLREMKQKWDDVTEYGAKADLRLIMKAGRVDAEDGGKKGYRLREEFRSKWTYDSEERRGHWAHGPV